MWPHCVRYQEGPNVGGVPVADGKSMIHNNQASMELYLFNFLTKSTFQATMVSPHSWLMV